MSQSLSTGNFGVASPVKDVNLRCVARYTLVVFFPGFFLVPLETGVTTAIKTNESIAHSLPFAPPVGGGFTLGNIQFALEQLPGSLFNSLIMSIPTTVGSVLFGSMVAYSLTVVSWRTQMGMLTLSVVGVFVPYQTVLAPFVRFWNNIFPLTRVIKSMVVLIPFFQGYHTGFVPLVVIRIVYGIPVYAILSRSYYQSLPNSLVEASKIDDASITKIYRRIILSISKPTFGVVFIYQFAQVYNGFPSVFMPVTGFDAPVAPVTLVLPVIGALAPGINFGTRISAASFAAVPTLILHVVSTKQFAKGPRTEA